ncbi:4Fe-4S dicluster domain-containing protein [Desulfuromonas sp. CSMB_57]|uniref:4Fe-4S dicluster domain-containing protein n=1 Tax=Desulfuromonas sp. CSMB_57 TaxID=2807629 RepID=UPI001CD51EAC|nr:4Fe-4S dicluster domain-containing protein [Desulfuromonas sp. CSMB_57]
MKKILVDYRKCVACKSCETACAVAHHPSGNLFGLIGDARTQVNVRVLGVEHEAFPVSCRHCDPAACLSACPAGAIARDPDSGAVVQHPERCQACAMCAMVCPFDAISFKHTHRALPGREVAFKCDLCHQRLARGEAPACVAACHSGALVFRELEPAREQRAKAGLKVYLLGEAGEPALFALHRELRRRTFARRRGEPT